MKTFLIDGDMWFLSDCRLFVRHIAGPWFLISAASADLRARIPE